MAFNSDNSIAVIKRPDGLYEKNTIDPSNSIPVDNSFIGPVDTEMRQGESRYVAPLTDEQRQRNTAEYALRKDYAEKGQDVPAYKEADWALSSQTADVVKNNLAGIVFTEGVIPAYNALKGIANASSPNSDVGKMIFDSALKGLNENSQVDNLGGAAAKAYPELPWQITGTMGAAAEISMFMPSVISGVASFMSKSNQFDIAYNNLTSSPKWADFTSHVADKAGVPVEQVEPILARDLYGLKEQMMKGTNYFDLLKNNLRESTGIDLSKTSVGLSIKDVSPKEGDSIFFEYNGVKTPGVIKSIEGQRATIEMGGKEVLATLSQLSIPIKSIKPITMEDMNSSGEQIPLEYTDNANKLIEGLNKIQSEMGVSLKRNDEFIAKGHKPFNSVFRSQEKQDLMRQEKTVDGKLRYPTATETTIHSQVLAVDIPTKSLKIDQRKLAEIANKNGFLVENISKTPDHVHIELPSQYSQLEKNGLQMKFNKSGKAIKYPLIDSKSINNIQNKLKTFKDMALKKEFAQESLDHINSIRKDVLGRINKFKDGVMAEELQQIPKHYFTNSPHGNTADQIMQELNNNYGLVFQGPDDLGGYLQKLDSQKENLTNEINSYKEPRTNSAESTIEKKKLQVAESVLEDAQRQMEKVMKQQEKTLAKEKKISLKEGRAIEAELRKKRYFGSDVTPQQRKELYVVALNKGVIYTDYSGKTHDKLQGIIRYYKGASFDELKNYLSSLSGDKTNPPRLFKLYGDINKDAEAMQIINKEREDWRDINAAEVYTLDPPRIIEKVSRQDLFEPNSLADNTFNVITAADDAMFNRKLKELADLDANRQGITANSKQSSELMRKFEAGEPLSNSEKKVVDFLRSKYDMWIQEANQMRELIGRKPIPYRQNYMTHIIESNMLHDFFKGDETGMGTISNDQMDAIRKGDYTKGNMPFNKFAQKRLGSKTKNDAIGNYIQYMNTLAKEIYFTPAISHSRKFIEYALIAQPNAYKALDRMLSDLKGKKSIVDQNLIGFIASSTPMQWIRTHIARSALIGNINFWAMNASNFATSYPELGNWVNFGMAKFLGNKEWRDWAFKNSKMLKSRQIDPDFIDQPVHTKLEEAVASITNLIEYNNIGAAFTGAYHKAISELHYSPEKALDYSDGIARKTQVGYKPYEVNAWMRSNSGKLYSQFQNWSFNGMNYILYDIGAANIPEDLASIMKEDKTNRTRWGVFVGLIAMAIAVNQIYKSLGLRGPYDATAVVPSVAGMNVGKYGDIGPARVAKNVKDAVFSKKPETREKATQRVAGAFVPGGTQAVRLMQGNILPDSKTGKKKTHLKD